MRIRSAAKLEANFTSLITVPTLEKALDRMELHTFELVFVAEELIDGVNKNFIEHARQKTGGKIASYVSIASGGKEQHEFASNLLEGFDAILSEPFSIDSFHSVLEIALSLLSKRTAELRKEIIEIALADAHTYIDTYALSVRHKSGQGVSNRAIAKLKDTLDSCYRSDTEQYFEAVIKKFTELASKKRESKGYSGASKRLREKLAEKEQ